MLLLHLCPTLNLQHSGVLEEEKNTRFYKLGMDLLLGIGAWNLRFYAKSSKYSSIFLPIGNYC